MQIEKSKSTWTIRISLQLCHRTMQFALTGRAIGEVAENGSDRNGQFMPWRFPRPHSHKGDRMPAFDNFGDVASNERVLKVIKSRQKSAVLKGSRSSRRQESLN